MELTSYPKNKINILLLERISEKAAAFFQQKGYTLVHVEDRALGEEELIRAIPNVHILGIRSKTQVTDRVVQAAQKLQAIGCFCIGTNQVDLDAATQSGIAVFNAPYSNTRSVAELVIGLAVMLMRRIFDKSTAAHQGGWLKDAAGSYELRNKTMGIVGYGNIGTQVGIMAEALGMKILYYDIQTRLALGNAVPAPALDHLLAESDIVTLHVPGGATTNGLINKNTLAYFKPGAVLINCARGDVADPAAVAEAVRTGLLSGAAFDVFPEEPERNGDSFTNPLQQVPNVILTPHIGGSTKEAQENIADDVSLKLLNYLEKGDSSGSHTLPALSLPLVEGTHRLLHIHNNVPGVLGEINKRLSENGINILGQYLKTNDRVGYVVLDVDRNLSTQAMALLRDVKETIKARLLY